MAARAISAMLGLWLFLSGVAWPHDRAHLVNAWIVGILAVTIALAAVGAHPKARYLNVALGVWLIFSAMFLRATTVATALNDVLVGIGLVFFGSLERLGRPSGPVAR